MVPILPRRFDAVVVRRLIDELSRLAQTLSPVVRLAGVRIPDALLGDPPNDADDQGREQHEPAAKKQDVSRTTGGPDGSFATALCFSRRLLAPG